MKNHMRISCFNHLIQNFNWRKTIAFSRLSDGNIYLVLIGPEKYDAIYSRIRYLISQKGGIAYVISHNYARITIDSDHSLLLEKTLTLHIVIILIKSVFKSSCT